MDSNINATAAQNIVAEKTSTSSSLTEVNNPVDPMLLRPRSLPEGTYKEC